jgi:hypothetical protein
MAAGGGPDDSAKIVSLLFTIQKMNCGSLQRA